ncbi:MAG: UbiX family flavin prenyltransferase [bacterium]
MKENFDSGIDRPSFVLAVTGASGAIYGFSLLKALISRSFFVHLIISKPGFKVIKEELGMFASIFSSDAADNGVPCGNWPLSSLNAGIKDEIVNKFGLYDDCGKFAFLDENFLEASIASGSAKNVKGMIVIPCSMGSLSRIANGNSGNLIERAADVMLKERKKLIVCPRETPFNDIHLKNMLSLYASGAVILPPSPAFYNKPRTIGDIIDFITGKILDSLDIENDIYARWKGYEPK